MRLAAVVTAVDADAIGPLCGDVREGLVTFLQREYPDAVPGPANAPHRHSQAARLLAILNN